jgi:hypothetical protein
MLNRILKLLLFACFAMSAVWAAGDPFVGKWKVNPSKSKITDEMKVEIVGENKYAFTFVPGAVDTIVADGTDQPTPDGTTLSVTVEGPNNWKVVRKKDGRRIISAIWTLSADSKTLDDAFTQYQPDGSPITAHLTDTSGRRAAQVLRAHGIARAPSSTRALSSTILPYDGDGLSLVSPVVGGTQNIKFDAKNYSPREPNAAWSSQTESQGKRIRVTRIEVSADLTILTISIHLVGDKQPGTILVFDRE